MNASLVATACVSLFCPVAWAVDSACPAESVSYEIPGDWVASLSGPRLNDVVFAKEGRVMARFKLPDGSYENGIVVDEVSSRAIVCIQPDNEGFSLQMLDLKSGKTVDVDMSPLGKAATDGMGVQDVKWRIGVMPLSLEDGKAGGEAIAESLDGEIPDVLYSIDIRQPWPEEGGKAVMTVRKSEAIVYTYEISPDWSVSFSGPLCRHADFIKDGRKVAGFELPGGDSEDRIVVDDESGRAVVGTETKKGNLVFQMLDLNSGKAVDIDLLPQKKNPSESDAAKSIQPVVGYCGALTLQDGKARGKGTVTVTQGGLSYQMEGTRFFIDIRQPWPAAGAKAVMTMQMPGPKSISYEIAGGWTVSFPGPQSTHTAFFKDGREVARFKLPEGNPVGKMVVDDASGRAIVGIHTSNASFELNMLDLKTGRAVNIDLGPLNEKLAVEFPENGPEDYIGHWVLECGALTREEGRVGGTCRHSGTAGDFSYDISIPFAIDIRQPWPKEGGKAVMTVQQASLKKRPDPHPSGKAERMH